MSIDVLIKQRAFGRKTMPLEVILGDQLYYGHLVNDLLNVGELGESEFIAYNPAQIGRGFSVVWNANEKKTIALRLLHPSTNQELKDFYAAIKRMVQYWKGKLIVDGRRISLSDFMSTYDIAVDFNNKSIKHLSQQILDGKHETLQLYSAMWPLAVGKAEATIFMENLDNYAVWLHFKQDMDVYFASPHFYVGENGIYAIYYLPGNMATVFPNHPAVPLGTIDSRTGKPLKCEDWRICLITEGKEKPLGELAYAKFLSIIPESKKSRYDGGHFLLDELTEEELQMFVNQ